MTYNFDPERWLEIRLARLDDRRVSGELDQTAYKIARAELERRYDAMLDRLDGTYRLPDRPLLPSDDGDGSA